MSMAIVCMVKEERGDIICENTTGMMETENPDGPCASGVADVPVIKEVIMLIYILLHG